MTTRGAAPLRAMLLGASAAAAVILGHLVDAVGLLPGVHESAAVRASALAPRFTVLTVAGAALLSYGVDALLRRGRTYAAFAALLGGQTSLLALPEVLGRAGQDGGEAWASLTLAVGLQVLGAALAVVLAVLLAERLLRLPSLVTGALSAWAQRVSAAPVRFARRPLVGGVPGRGPPGPVCP